GRKTIVTAQNKEIFSLSWALKGDRIAFAYGAAFQTSERKTDVEIETIAADGSARKTLTARAGMNAFPAFSPDGKQLVFHSTRDGPKNLYIMNADGTGVRRLTEGKWTDTHAAWSPTGEWIAFAGKRDDGKFAIWLIRPDGTGLKRLVGPDGTHM